MVLYAHVKSCLPIKGFVLTLGVQHNTAAPPISSVARSTAHPAWNVVSWPEDLESYDFDLPEVSNERNPWETSISV